MNYIAEIRAFYDWSQFNPTPADAQALWHALMYLNNKCAMQINGQWLWRVEFTVANTTLQSMLKFSRTQLDRMRNVLIQSRRIEYRKGRGNQSGTYRMVPFDTQYVAQTVTQSVTQTDTQAVTQVWRNRGTLNNNTYTPINNTNIFFGDGDDGAHANETVEKYVENQDMATENYFGYTERTRNELKNLSEAIFTQFTNRKPTVQDEAMVFQYTKNSVCSKDGKWDINFPKDKVDLLCYAFDHAAKSGNPGNWQYISGIMRKLNNRGINTLSEADGYDFDRDQKKGRW